MQAEDIDELCNPGQEYTLIDPSPLLHSVCHFVNNLAASWKHYDMMQTIEHLHRPNDVILSFDQVKRCVQWLSGVVCHDHTNYIFFFFLLFLFFVPSPRILRNVLP